MIIDKYQNKFSNITHVIKKKNGGLSSARNAGHEASRGQYIAYIDSDDVISASSLLAMLSLAKKNNLDIVSAETTTFWNSEGRHEHRLAIPGNLVDMGVVSGLDFFSRSFELGYRRINCWNKLYKRDFLNSNNIRFIENLRFEDVPFTFEAFFLADKVAATHDNFYFYRQRPGSIMTAPNQRSDVSRKKIVVFLLDLIEQKQFNGNQFEDYIIYLLWEYSCGTRDNCKELCSRIFSRKKYSFKGAIRLLSIYLSLASVLD